MEKRPSLKLVIVSGGQTGVDRAALSAALAAGVAIDGWCPRGRRAEDGTIPRRFRLRETRSDEYAERTRWNVRDSDATLILARLPLRSGTRLTRRFARQLGKPCFVAEPAKDDPTGAADWIRRGNYRRVNVAGPRESKSPGIGRAANRFVRRVLELLKRSARRDGGRARTRGRSAPARRAGRTASSRAARPASRRGEGRP